ncbi:nucleotidyltransferase substrate binding protein [Candidatus Babeliales bacterium]|nr:nucleotidyltransferase substrate binding protein [Candidatus Babeliales bacterium]MBY0353404.1 nucleotidyltransferase substrate binding protein [Candidatus Babeliales bacterium]
MEKITGIEKLMVKQTTMLQALSGLKEEIDSLNKICKNESSDEKLIRTYRNSVTKLFEISFDLFWKYVKEYLWGMHGIEQQSPKSVFRECFKLDFTNKTETAHLLDIVDDRNRLVHTYNEEVAIKISYKIPRYYDLMKKLVDAMKV